MKVEDWNGRCCLSGSCDGSLLLWNLDTAEAVCSKTWITLHVSVKSASCKSFVSPELDMLDVCRCYCNWQVMIAVHAVAWRLNR